MRMSAIEGELDKAETVSTQMTRDDITGKDGMSEDWGFPPSPSADMTVVIHVRSTEIEVLSHGISISSDISDAQTKIDNYPAPLHFSHVGFRPIRSKLKHDMLH